MKKIIEMFAFVMEGDGGNEDEGIIGWEFLSGEWMPLVGADMNRVDSLKVLAKKISENKKKPIKIIKFTNREQIGEILPE